MWLDDLTTYLRGENLTEVGTSVFTYTLPSDIKTGLMVTTDYRGVSFDPEIPGYYRGSIQIVARAKKSATAEEIAMAASNALTMTETEVGDIFVRHIRPRHLPVPYPRSNGDYYEASVNFDICFLSDMA